MQCDSGIAIDRNRLLKVSKTRVHNRDNVVAQRNGGYCKYSVPIRYGRKGEIGVAWAKRNAGATDRPVLRVMNHSVNLPKDIGTSLYGPNQDHYQYKNRDSAHRSLLAAPATTAKASRRTWDRSQPAPKDKLTFAVREELLE